MMPPVQPHATHISEERKSAPQQTQQTPHSQPQELPPASYVSPEDELRSTMGRCPVVWQGE